MRIIILTEEQATALRTYLLASTSYRNSEAKVCEKLAAELNDDGSPRFPNMKGNARWWKEANKIIDEVGKAIDEAEYKKEVVI